VAGKDPVTAAEGAILPMERLWPALQQVDSSSGALGTGVNKAVHALIDTTDPFVRKHLSPSSGAAVGR
jgi:hypothetical protein